MKQDTIHQKKARGLIAESERKYRALMEALNEGVWVIDADGVTTFVNPRMAEMLGYTVGEMLGRHLFSFAIASAAAGSVLTVNGFLLLFRIPFFH